MKSGKWWVACFECKHGINGKQDCQINLSTLGLKAFDIKHGCSIGELMDKFKEPLKINKK